MEKTKLTIKQMILNFKKLMKNPINLLFIGFFIFISLTLPTIFIPFNYGAGVSFSILIITISGVTYSSISHELRHSTIYSNLRMTKSNKFTFHLSTLFTMLIITFVASLLLFFSFSIFNQFDWLLSGWRHHGPIADTQSGELLYYHFTFEFYSLIFYATIVLTLMMFSLSFCLQHVLKTSRTYYIFLITVLVLDVIFGGALNRYYYTTSIMKPLVSPLFPWSIYWFSFIFPFYSIGEFINTGAQLTQTTFDGSQLSHVGNLFYSNWNNMLFGLLSFKQGTQWVWLMYMPYIEIATFLGVGVIISKLVAK